jgi:hypothetical protein
MTKLYAEIYRLKQGAIQARSIAERYGQRDAARAWEAKVLAYTLVLGLLDDPIITPSWWKRLICSVFHQKYSLKCPNCGGTF